MIAIDQVFIICLCCHWNFLCDLQLTERNENLIEFLSLLDVYLYIGMLKYGDVGQSSVSCHEYKSFIDFIDSMNIFDFCEEAGWNLVLYQDLGVGHDHWKWNRELGHPGKVSRIAYLPPFNFVTESRTKKVFKEYILQKHADPTASVEFDKYFVDSSRNVPTFCFLLLLQFPSCIINIDMDMLLYRFCTIRTTASLCFK